MWGKVMRIRSNLILYHPAIIHLLNNTGSVRPRWIVTSIRNSSSDSEKPKNHPESGSHTTQTQSPDSVSTTFQENTTASETQSQNVSGGTTSSATPIPQEQSLNTKPTGTSSTTQNYPPVNGLPTKSQGDITTTVPTSSTTERPKSQNVTTSSSQTTSHNQSSNTTQESKPQDTTTTASSEIPKSSFSGTQTFTPQTNPGIAQATPSSPQGNTVTATTVLPISHGQSTANATQSPTFESRPETSDTISSKPHVQSTVHADINKTQTSPATSSTSSKQQQVQSTVSRNEKNILHDSSTAATSPKSKEQTEIHKTHSSTTISSNTSPRQQVQSTLSQGEANVSQVLTTTSTTTHSKPKLKPTETHTSLSQAPSKTSTSSSKPHIKSKEQTETLRAPHLGSDPTPSKPSTAPCSEVNLPQSSPSSTFTSAKSQAKPEPASLKTKDKSTTSSTGNRLNTSQVERPAANTPISAQSQQQSLTATKIISNTQENPLSFHSKPPLAQNAASSLKESQSFLMNLFLGVLKPDQVFPFPNVLTADQRETIQVMINPVEKLFKNINDAARNDLEEKVPQKCLDALREMGLFGLQVPQDLGGLGLNNTQYARLVEVIGGNDLALAITLGSHQSIGLKGIQMVGTSEQKAKYLPHLSKGKQFAAFCLTESSAGSDIKSIKTRAVLSPDGKHYILNGSKLWVSNGGICDIMTVFAKTHVTEKEGKKANNLTAFIVERSFRGVSSGHPEKKMGIKASNTTQIFFNDVKVPVENVLGEIGGGYKLALNILNSGRFSLGAALSGTMREVMKKTVEFAKTRVQFGNHIISYGTTQEKIARMAMLHYVTETITYLVSGNMDGGSTDYHMEAAVCKVFSSEATWKVTDEAIQIFGGLGYMRETGLERILRDVRVFRIFEGPNEVLHHFIALQGLRYAGIHMQELKKAFKDPRNNINFILNRVRPHFLSAVGLNWATSSSMKNHTHAALTQAAKDTRKSIDQFSHTIALISLKYGKDITKEQFILNRIAKAAIDIYASIAILSRATDSLNKKLPSAKHELLMTQVWCDEANRRVVANMKAISIISNQKLNFHKMGQISKNVCEANGIVQQNPV